MELAAPDETSNRAAATAPRRWGWGGVARALLALSLGSLAAASAAASTTMATPAAALAKLAPTAAMPAAMAGTARSGAGDAGGGGGAGNAGQSDAALDQVVQEVLRMLQAKVSEAVVLHWLDTTGQRPGAVGSREVVELARAGASDALIKKILDLAARRESPQPPAGPAASGAAATAPPAAATTAPPAAAATAPPGRAATMHWRIAYHPNFGADDERWDLYVYLDGRYLAAVKSPIVSFVDPPLQFDSNLAPGHHVLRVVEERHLRKLGRDGWTHAAKVAPAALAFEVAPGAAGLVDLRLETRPRGGPIALRVTQGDAELVRTEPAIGQPDAWPWLCEEVTAGQPAGKRPSRSARGELGSCLHWADLWPGVDAPPSRDAVRADLERQGFRPDPARSGQ
jgi:hypothetical protein